MAWLGTWQNRIKWEIDYTKIDSDLSDFPNLVPISISAGKDDQDISAVFDELTSDANRKKIAITTLNGTTQCYVEIERWDDANEKAELWVKVPSISSVANTVLYLYYDSAQADNTTYVGDTTDTPAQTVWDSDFEAVYHMAQDPNGDVADAIKDSTSNANHGTPNGSMTTADLVDGKVGKAIDFDGSSDYLNLGDLSQIEGSDELTLEGIVRAASYPSGNNYIIGKYGAYGTPAYIDRSFVLSVFSDGKIHFATVNTAGDAIYEAISSNTLSTGTYYYVAGVTKAGALQKIFIDNSEAAYTDQETYPAGQTIGANSEPAYISKYGGGTYHWQGPLDEIRVSTIARSTAWLKATYYS
ncbi:DUF2341 domain-containing protein, partial [bacterium]|nr:DUF2341 domain-containing protein [bacterium]